MIPAAFDYLRAHTTDEAFAHLQQHGAEARVLAGGQSLIPAMRFRLARPAVLVDINSLTDLGYLRIERSGAGDRRDRARQRHRARAVDRRAPVEPHPRCVARGRRSGRAADGHGRRQPVPQRSRRRLDGGRARLSRHSRRSRQGRNAPRPDRRFPRRQLRDGGRGRRDGARRGVPGARRSHGRFVPEGRAQGRRLRHRGGGRAGVAERRRHDPERGRGAVGGRARAPCAWTRPSSCWPARSRPRS